MQVSVQAATQTSLNIDSFEDLIPFYPKLRGIRYNHVVSAINSSQHSDLLTSPLDRLALKAIRSQSELIVTTGLTARTEELKASAFADLLVLTDQPKLELPALDETSSRKVLVTTEKLSVSNLNAHAVGTIQGSPTSWFTGWVKGKYDSIALESGIRTAMLFAAEGLIAEACLTVTSASTQHQAEAIAKDFLIQLGLVAKQIQSINDASTWLFRFSVS